MAITIAIFVFKPNIAAAANDVEYEISQAYANEWATAIACAL